MKLLENVTRAELPDPYFDLVDPNQPLPENTRFFCEEPMPWLTIFLALIFGVPFGLGALAGSYDLFSKLLQGTMETDDWVFGPFLLVLTWGVVFFSLKYSQESLNARKMVKEGQWRVGAFLLDKALLIQKHEDECYLLPRAAVLEINSRHVPGEGGGSKGHHVIDIIYRRQGENFLLEYTYFPHSELMNALQNWLKQK